MLSVRNMAILLCLCDIVQGMLFTPLKRGLFPRHLRAEKARFFVHARILDGSSRHAGRKGKKSFKKIVQICALLCIEINALEEGVLLIFYSLAPSWPAP